MIFMSSLEHYNTSIWNTIENGIHFIILLLIIGIFYLFYLYLFDALFCYALNLKENSTLNQNCACFVQSLKIKITF